MIEFLAKHPEGTLADWARTSVWSRDTGGTRDRDGAPKRAQGGTWRSLFHKAQDELAARPVDFRTVISGALQGRGLPIMWWLALVLVPGALLSRLCAAGEHTQNPYECAPQGIDSSCLTWWSAWRS